MNLKILVKFHNISCSGISLSWRDIKSFSYSFRWNQSTTYTESNSINQSESMTDHSLVHVRWSSFGSRTMSQLALCGESCVWSNHLGSWKLRRITSKEIPSRSTSYVGVWRYTVGSQAGVLLWQDSFEATAPGTVDPLRVRKERGSDGNGTDVVVVCRCCWRSHCTMSMNIESAAW